MISELNLKLNYYSSNRILIMKSKIQLLVVLTLSLSVISCTNLQNDSPSNSAAFDIAQVKSVIQVLNKGWGNALKTKDLSIIENLYDNNAHYLPDDEKAIHGKENIVQFWKSSIDSLTDIQLNMESLEGTKDLLYETGNGIVLFINDTGGTDTLSYKYVNVWKLQDDGSYKVVIDTFNDINIE